MDQFRSSGPDQSRDKNTCYYPPYTCPSFWTGPLDLVHLITRSPLPLLPNPRPPPSPRSPSPTTLRGDLDRISPDLDAASRYWPGGGGDRGQGRSEEAHQAFDELFRLGHAAWEIFSRFRTLLLISRSLPPFELLCISFRCAPILFSHLLNFSWFEQNLLKKLNTSSQWQGVTMRW